MSRSVPQEGHGSLNETKTSGSSYYINPLAMPALDAWPREFARIADLQFDSVVLAPPFATGRDGSIFLTADHERLHDHLGGGNAEAGLRHICAMARAEGLDVMLDLRCDRVDGTAAMLADHPEFRANNDNADAPPDPRHPIDRGLTLRRPAPPALTDWWLTHVRAWSQAGVRGFRCLEPTLGSSFWTPIIEGVHEVLPAARFIAWTQGLDASEVAGLRGTGFNLTACSLPWWDFEAAWFGEEVARLAAVAPVLTMPESPFAPRLAACITDRVLARRAAERAVSFAALSGHAWLLPMGFEFGAVDRMGFGPAEAERFDALRRDPRIDLQDAVRAANRQRHSQPIASECAAPVVRSSPNAPIAQVLRQSNDAQNLLVLANPSLTAARQISAAEIAANSPAPAAFTYDASIALNAGEVRFLPVNETEPVRLTPDPADASARGFAASPRIAIEAISPSVDDGRFPVKRIVGHRLTVTADIFADGATKLAVRLRWRPADESEWREVPMRHTINDIYTAEFLPDRVGTHHFTISAWVDVYGAFLDEIRTKHGAGVDIALERREGSALLEAARTRLPSGQADELGLALDALRRAEAAAAVGIYAQPRVTALMRQADPRPFLVTHEPILRVDIERRAAGFASWYEIFPRSQSGDTERHGTFDDVIAQLPRVRDMGFDVLYFPPIHPIGVKNRKGRNNSLTAEAGDPGSPYAIGAEAGGHDAVHPELGTLEDFRRLVAAAAQHGLEIALDFAIQCSPDHPWLKDHPDWFSYRPDGSIRYAENPPKKYEDIVNVDFYAADAVPALWIALRDVVLFWVDAGVKLFRVDNPHTKPLPFWEWMIGQVRDREPDCVFLSEAFTRPKVMYRLAKVGFSQSYTYFTWRNTPWELGQYIAELNRAPVSDFFRPHFFVNTPDINPTFLQHAGRPGHLIRAALAATLSGLWGVYNGFELCEARPVKPGKEEYLDSEKYELRAWDYDRPGNIVAEITALNRLRRQNPALQTHLGTTVLASGHEDVMVFAKATPDMSNVVLVAVSMNPHTAVDTHIELPQTAMGLSPGAALRAENLMGGGEERWEGTHRALHIAPHTLPFAIWRLRAADRI